MSRCEGVSKRASKVRYNTLARAQEAKYIYYREAQPRVCRSIEQRESNISGKYARPMAGVK